MKRIDRDDSTSACAERDTSQMVAALEEYQEALGAGHPVDREAFLAQHAEVADRLAGYLEALELIQSVGEAVTPQSGSAGNAMPLGPGDSLGEFRILREVGRGGMGVVFEAEQLGLPERRVALKVLSMSAALDPRTLQRFRVETQAAACLNHPNIVPVFSAGCERDIPFYAMPLIKGRSLAEILNAMSSDERTSALASLPPAAVAGPEPRWHVAVARLGLQAAEALEHAHALGVVHRDIKPSNLIVDAEWRLWVTDFGLARLACNDPGLTSTGELVGTLRYMSPEQIRGEPGAGDARTDIYALGVTLYEATTLRPVFEASDRSALLHHILDDDPPAPRSIDPGIPKDLETIILKAMDKLPTARYATARDLADDLRRFLDDRPILARRPSLVERSVRWARRHRALLATAVAGIGLSMAIGMITLWRAKRQAEENLAKVTEARKQEFRAFDWAIGINDMVTVPLIQEATSAGVLDQGRRLASYRQVLSFYTWMVKTLPAQGLRIEVVAKAARRAGGLRLMIGDRGGLDDYARAIQLYEGMAAGTPDAIWYRADLISTLREYAGHLEKLDDDRAASARRRACEIAEGLLVDDNSTLKCFRMGVIPQFKALVEILSNVPDATPADRSLADRMKKWLKENPEPPGYLPRP
jgi:serine/threonine protein kinase